MSTPSKTPTVGHMTEASGQGPDLRPSACSPSVLFVSELQDEVDMYSVALELSGFRTTHVSTLAEAFDVSAAAPVAVILDAGRTGYGLRRDNTRHHGVKAGLRVPVIMLTTQATGSDRMTAGQIGCDRLLQKPCLPDVLVQALEDVLDDYAERHAEDRESQ